eukprot:scaffold94142_cov54-Phaeocystis_antarctica.AAC.2
MSVALEVSKLSGWLNAVAPCRVERRAYDAGRGIWAGGGRGHGPAAAHTRHARGEGPALKAGGLGHARSAPQRLVERPCGLPSRKEGVRCGARCGTGGERAWAGGSARAACTGRGPGCEGGEGSRACAERTSNM